MKSDSLCKKVSVSLPSNVHKWLIQEAQKESENRGSRVTVSSLIQEIINDWKNNKSQGNVSAQPQTGRKIIAPHKRSVGGSSTATTDRSLKTG
jgi:hypothetical protein